MSHELAVYDIESLSEVMEHLELHSVVMPESLTCCYHFSVGLAENYLWENVVFLGYYLRFSKSLTQLFFPQL
jgi:hypothetical protein